MIIFGVKFCLWGDEIVSIKHEHIVKKLAVISYDGTIEYFPMKTLGKEEDNEPTTLAIWNDKNLLHIDLIRHLTLLTHVTGIKTGCILANVQHLENTCKDDVITDDYDHVCHVIFLDDFKNIDRLITHLECKIELHSLHNAACMLDMFDNDDREDMRKSARHKTALS